MITVEFSDTISVMESMGDRLRAARVQAGYTSATKAAEALGVSASTYRAHENGQNEYKPDEAERYARRFGTSAAHLLTGAPAPTTVVAEPAPAPKPNGSFPPRFQQFPESTVPLLGQTAGGPNGRFILNGQEIGRVFCPPGLAGVDDAYAVHIYGTSMEPKFEPGETVWLHPHSPVRSGDYVVAQIFGDDEDHIETYIKQFVSRSSKVLRLRQLNPDEGETHELEFDATKVFSVHKVVFHAMV